MVAIQMIKYERLAKKQSKTSVEHWPMQLTNPFSQEQKEHQINRWSGVAEAEVSGLTNSFSRAGKMKHQINWWGCIEEGRL